MQKRVHTLPDAAVQSTGIKCLLRDYFRENESRQSYDGVKNDLN